MKKILLMLLMLLGLNACTLDVGNFPENRQRLHKMGEENQDGFCERNPDRCIKGVPW